MNSDYHEYDEKSQRRRVVAITAVIAATVLIITAWAIVQIISNSGTQTGQPLSEVAIDDPVSGDNSESGDAPAIEAVSSSGTSTAASSSETTNDPSESVNSDESADTDSSKASNVSTVTSVPETGAEDLLPLALVAGSLAAFISSRRLAKNPIET